MKKGKSTDALMRHIRDKHHIAIGGSSEKRALLDMGYYHGYKAYKLTDDSQLLGVTDFKQVQAIYNFDSSLKEIIYPVMMRVETALKNRTIAIVTNGASPSIDAVFNKSLNRYHEEAGRKKYRERIADRLRLKKRIDELISERYASTLMIQHYLHNGEGVPIWAIFELFSMGDFGAFLNVMNRESRVALAESVGIYQSSIDTDATFIARHVFLLKDLRNAIAHNSVVFDCRFKRTSARDTVTNQLENVLNVDSITFRSITDYVALLVYYLRALGTPKRDITTFINSFRNAVSRFKQEVQSQDIVDKVLSTNILNKIRQLKKAV